MFPFIACFAKWWPRNLCNVIYQILPYLSISEEGFGFLVIVQHDVIGF